jgi:hypothetical protein
MSHMDNAIHPFEAAGLGKAPFRFVGMVEQDTLYGEVILNRAEWERTGIAMTAKPGGSCAFCGNYILHMYQIKSADGRRFHVGCDCVEKTEDRALVSDIKVATRKREKARRAAAAKRVTGELEALLADATVRAALTAKPHPNAKRAAQGETLLDSIEWARVRCGAAGRAKLLKQIKAAI